MRNFGFTRVTAAVVSATAGILAGIVGVWLTGHWIWGVAAGVLFLICVVAGAEIVKARAEERDGQVDKPHETREVKRTGKITFGRDTYAKDSIIATGDVNQTRITKINQRGAPIPVLIVICIGALIISAGGTALLVKQGGDPIPPVPSARAATYNETNSSGDSVTQTISFGKPIPLSQLPQVASAAPGACQNLSFTLDAAARDLVVPFNIVSTLNSSLPVQAPVGIILGNFVDSNGNGHGMTEWPIVVGSYANGIGCDTYNDNGTVALSKTGVPTSFQGWIIFSDAITPNFPRGNISALGQTWAQINMNQAGMVINKINVTGPQVCIDQFSVKSLLGQSVSSPPFLHIAGPQLTWEQCLGHYAASPN